MSIKKYNLNVLLVDDDKEIATIFEKSLNYLVDKVVVASNGKDAIEKFNTNDIDLVITDLSMPNMSGQELIKNLKNIDDDIQIIVISAYSKDITIINEVINLGVTRLINKPINMNLLRKMLEEIFDLKQLKYYKTHLHKVNKKLSQQITEHIHKIEQKDAIIASQSKNVLMGEMFAMITHQLKQPIASSMMLVGGIKLKLEMDYNITKDDWYKHIDMLMRNFEYFKDTIDGFNIFYKNKNKGLINLYSIVQNTLKLIEPTIKKENINIQIDIDKNISLYTYENELKQVLLNLINNAREVLVDEHTKNPTIQITATKYNQNNISLCVIDNAGSLSDSIKDKIFNEHFTTKGDKGSGLGLYMTKIIVEKQFHGFIEAFVSDGKTTFKIDLPNQEES